MEEGGEGAFFQELFCFRIHKTTDLQPYLRSHGNPIGLMSKT